MTTKVAIVGLGKMGILHTGIMNSCKDAQVTAVCEKDKFLLRITEACLPERISLYSDHLEMIESEKPDAVIVTTPIGTHASLIEEIAKADANLSIFVEKPLAATYLQAKRACEAARKLRGTSAVGFQKRFSPIFQKTKELVESTVLGDLILFRAHIFSSDILRNGSEWRSRKGAGGVLVDLAPHLLDIILWFFGEPVTVKSTRRRIYSNEVDDYVHSTMSFKSGLIGHMDACWSVKAFRLPEIWIEVNGKEGTLTATDDYVKLTRYDESSAAGRSEVFYRQSFDTSASFLLADPEYTWEDEAFLKGVRERTLSQTNFERAAKVNALMDRINATK